MDIESLKVPGSTATVQVYEYRVDHNMPPLELFARAIHATSGIGNKELTREIKRQEDKLRGASENSPLKAWLRLVENDRRGKSGEEQRRLAFVRKTGNGPDGKSTTQELIKTRDTMGLLALSPADLAFFAFTNRVVQGAVHVRSRAFTSFNWSTTQADHILNKRECPRIMDIDNPVGCTDNIPTGIDTSHARPAFPCVITWGESFVIHDPRWRCVKDTGFIFQDSWDGHWNLEGAFDFIRNSRQDKWIEVPAGSWTYNQGIAGLVP